MSELHRQSWEGSLGPCSKVELVALQPVVSQTDGFSQSLLERLKPRFQGGDVSQRVPALRVWIHEFSPWHWHYDSWHHNRCDPCPSQPSV